VDGGDPSYFEYGRKNNVIKNISGFMDNGFYTVGECVVPTFTNPNNMSIVTGGPPSLHGISGNFFLDPHTKEAVMMNDPKYLRCQSLLQKFSEAGYKVAAITAKDKLCRLLGHGLNTKTGSIFFSSECADKCTLETNGITNVLDFVGKPLPDVYSAQLSLFVLESGLKLLQDKDKRPDIMYLSLTDYIQHKHAPGSEVSNDFHFRLDELIGRIYKENVIVGITADHGMNNKFDQNGEVKVIFLQDELDNKFGKNKTQVICPITDPYVVHHGALGGFVRVYCNDSTLLTNMTDFIKHLPGIALALSKQEAVTTFELPEDREADIVVIGDKDTVIGSAKSTHDLSMLKGERLRSHGSIEERKVPIIISEPINESYLNTIQKKSNTLRNYDIFDIVLNAT
jgi:phosphonoacetate hydrolase